MDRGLALQNPNDTPGSVQSAAFNHFNRMKAHMSTSNIPGSQLQRPKNGIKESQEDLDFGDYNVNDRAMPSNQFEAIIAPKTDQQSQIASFLNNNSKVNSNFIDRIPKDSANISIRSNESANAYQSINKKSNTISNFNQNPNMGTIPQSEAASFGDQVDEYYTVRRF